MRKSIILVITIFAALLIITLGTWSLQSAKDTAHNNFRTANAEAEIVEDFTSPSTPLKPGDPPYPKKVWVENKSNAPVFVRVMVLPVVQIETGGEDRNTISANDAVVLDIDTVHWKDGGDGYYYYLGYLPVGEATPPIFNSVKLKDTLQNGLYNDAYFTIDVKSEVCGLNKPEYSYRLAWWGSSTAPAANPLRDIDLTLKALADIHA